MNQSTISGANTAAFRRLCVETLSDAIDDIDAGPAAFRRLCVETVDLPICCIGSQQPPLGGCVLKLPICLAIFTADCQPPLGGCVLKHGADNIMLESEEQPPLGGCVLKRRKPVPANLRRPAAFRRLCVETANH